MTESRSCRKNARQAFSWTIFGRYLEVVCLARISEVRLATMFRMSSLNCSENLCFLGA